MNPNPLSIRRRAIVPVGIPVSSDARQPGTIPGTSRPPDERTYEARQNSDPVARRQKSWASVGKAGCEVKRARTLLGSMICTLYCRAFLPEVAQMGWPDPRRGGRDGRISDIGPCPRLLR